MRAHPTPLAMKNFNPMAEERIHAFRSQNLPPLTCCEPKSMLPRLNQNNVKRSTPDINLGVESLESNKLPALFAFRTHPQCVNVPSMRTSL